MSTTVGVDDLREEHKEAIEWDFNPLKKAILSLLEGSLNNESYRKLTKEMVIEEVQKMFELRGLLESGRTNVSAQRLIRKLEKQKTRDDVIIALGDCLLA